MSVLRDVGAQSLLFFVNGKKIVDSDVDPEWTLIHYLRKKLRLTGTKLGCASGGCGACTVVISRYDGEKISHYSVNACLYPVCAVHGLSVTTVEGLGTVKNMHPIQERLANAHGSQCGFCSPGFVMSMYALIRNHPNPTQQQVETAFEGNLCRCTGYRPILNGMKTFVQPCGMGDQCCRNNKNEDCDRSTAADTGDSHKGTYAPVDDSQDPIFPSDLKVNHNDYHGHSMIIRGPRVTWYRPAHLNELLRMKSENPDAKIVNGNTRLGLETKFENQLYCSLIYPSMVRELTSVNWLENGVEIGASVTLTQLDHISKQAINDRPGHQTHIFLAIVERLRWFAGHQIRNVCTIGGNIVTASPVSDLNPIFMAAGCKIKLQSSDGCREVAIDEHFFTGPKKTIIRPEEIVMSVTIPYTKQNEYFYGYKQARRRESDLSIVNAGMRVRFSENSAQVQELILSYGGMAATTVMAITVATNAKGRSWDESLLCDVCSWLETDLPLDASAPGGSVKYRRTLTTSFFYKFYLSVLKDLHADGVLSTGLPVELDSATQYYQAPPTSSSQVYHKVSPDDFEAVGEPLVHSSGYKQVTGEAVYTDDLPRREGELFLALVSSTVAHGRILSVETEEALRLPGVRGYIDHTDVPGINLAGSFFNDEQVFASEEVHCIGQTIGGIVAVDEITARQAVKLVKVHYQTLPHIVTIEEAIASDSYQTRPLKMELGDVDEGFREADVVVEGEQRLRGQEHFYLEPQVCLAVPSGEDDCMQVISASQAPTELQACVARVLGVPNHKIEGHVKRLGGGFGGKEIRACLLAQPAAVAARKFNCAVRCVLERDEDMAITGGRHPFYGKYKIGAKSDGRIVAFDVQLFSNGGYCLELSEAVMVRALFAITNAYYIPNVRAVGRVCKTNLPTNTAFRGFGCPQAMFICEDSIDKLSRKHNMPAHEIRKKNLFKAGDTCHYGGVKPEGMESLTRCWDDCMKQSQFYQRQKHIQQFNSANKWKKRGISIIPTVFSIGFDILPLNQASALVHVYTDGSVLVTHGGVEMGQGIHTKMIQVASQVLRIPPNKIYINETSTRTVPNTSPTSASVSSNLNGWAVMDACQKLMSNLAPIRESNPTGSWEEWVGAAYGARIHLSATGHYAMPKITGFNLKKNEGNPFLYYTMGVGCSEVEVDCLTGDHKVLRTDIVMDAGNSLNPAIDIGQIEGAFMQGYGLFMMEELRHSPSGFLYTRGPSNYKIPAAGDVPAQFNVTLLKDAPNPSAVYSSKGVGEPPLFLASSVYHAAKEAIRAHRTEHGHSIDFSLLSPATPEHIRLTCLDRFNQQFADTDSSRPAWDVVA